MKARLYWCVLPVCLRVCVWFTRPRTVHVCLVSCKIAHPRQELSIAIQWKNLPSSALEITERISHGGSHARWPHSCWEKQWNNDCNQLFPLASVLVSQTMKWSSITPALALIAQCANDSKLREVILNTSVCLAWPLQRSSVFFLNVPQVTSLLQDCGKDLKGR